jgi:hypothetical protein
MVFVVARFRTFGSAAAAPFIRPSGADSSVAGPFLTEKLLGASRHFASAERRVRPGSLVGKVHEHDIVEELSVNLASELLGVDFHRTDRLTLPIEDIQA